MKINRSDSRQILLLTRIVLIISLFLCSETVLCAPVQKHIEFLEQKVNQAGYHFESYEVLTEDDYILQLFRIYSPEKRRLKKELAYPVLMWHGLFQDAGAYVFNLNKGVRAPAFQAADAGLDVWLANSRGNMYSNDHKHYNDQKNNSEHKRAYWNFSWAEIGRYDMPAVINTVLRETQQEKIAYVGYSQGTIQMFYALSTNQEFLQEHVSVFVALAPCALISNPNKSTQILSNNAYWMLEGLESLLGWDVVEHPYLYADKLNIEICNSLRFAKSIIPSKICDLELTKEEAKIKSEVYNGSGTSVKNIKHMAQQIRSKNFVEYDTEHGVKTNPRSITGKISGTVNSYVDIGAAKSSVGSAATYVASWPEQVSSWTSDAFRTVVDRPLFGRQSQSGKQLEEIMKHAPPVTNDPDQVWTIKLFDDGQAMMADDTYDTYKEMMYAVKAGLQYGEKVALDDEYDCNTDIDESYLEAETQWLNDVLKEQFDHESELQEGSDGVQPWDIDLSKIANVPIFMIASTSDSLCQPADVQTLFERIKREDNKVAIASIDNVTHSQILSGQNLDHIDRYVIPALLKYTKQPDTVFKRAFSQFRSDQISSYGDESWL